MFQVSRCVSSLIFSFALVICFAVASALTTTPADASVPMSPQKKGIGSEAGMPKPPFKFDKEDVTGANPKNYLLSNWDAKPTNNNVLGMCDGQGRVKAQIRKRISELKAAAR